MDLFRPVCAAVAARTGGQVFSAAADGDVQRLLARLPAGAGATVHLCFAPPHAVALSTACFTVPVFGWGMGSIPSEDWPGAGGSQDWRVPLARLGGAICVSEAACVAVRAAMGADFPVCVIHPPIPSAGASRLAAPLARGQHAGLHVPSGGVLDTAAWAGQGPPHEVFRAEDDLAAASAATASEEVLFLPEPVWRKTWRYRLGVTRLHLGQWYGDAVRDVLPPRLALLIERAARKAALIARRLLALARKRGESRAAVAAEPSLPDDSAWSAGEQVVRLDGTVFSACHSIWDRSWSDAVSAFVFAFRDVADATLVIQTHTREPAWRQGVTAHLRRLLPYRCRIVLLDAVLPETALEAWIAATAFYVCASHAEAFPLPMMRFMANGAPVISPAHSALADLTHPGCAVPVGSTQEHDYWPHDPREKLHTTSHRLRWPDLRDAYQVAYRIAADDADYARMSAEAATHITFLSRGAEADLEAFLQQPAPAAALRAPATAREIA